VKFPVENFDLTDYIINNESMEDYGITMEDFADQNNEYLKSKMVEESQFDSKKPMIYDLYGVINHYGSMNFGHYTSFVKNNGVWR